MKKIAIILIICLILGGCGRENNEISIEKTSNTIEQSLSNMESIDESTLKEVYNIDFDIIEEYVIKVNSDGDLYAILKTDNKVKTKEDMDYYFDKVKEFNTAYSPERLKILENRLEKEIGNYLIYIVSSNAEEIYQDILDNID